MLLYPAHCVPTLNSFLHATGKGTVIYKNSDKYEGEWAFGLRHGLGTLWIYKVSARLCISRSDLNGSDHRLLFSDAADIKIFVERLFISC